MLQKLVSCIHSQLTDKPIQRISLACLALWSSFCYAEQFKVDDIRVEGLQRVSAGTVFNYLPVKTGQTFDTNASQQVVSELFATKLFSDIKLARDGNTLVVQVTEFPVINEIQLKGNSGLATSSIKEAFSKAGFAEGQPFNPAMQQEMTNQLYQQYHATSKFQVEINSKIETLPRGRINVIFDIKEGKTGKIKAINFVGNHAYSDDQLRKQLDTSEAGMFSMFSKNSQINGERMQADYDRLADFYQDRGFIDFKINSVQTSLNDDKTEAYLTINMTEGNPYTFTGYKISGNTIVSEAELQKFVKLKAGDTYNRGQLREAIENMQNRLADEGYAKAQVEAVPDIDRLTRQVFINLVVNPGERYTVRRIEFTGNSKSYDSVLRREMRQQEMAPYSASDIERSEQRLRRLPQIENIDKTLRPVEGHSDQVDLVYTVTERATSYIQGGVGYGDSSGMMFTLEYNDDNFFGTGNRFAANFGKSSSSDSYGLSFTNPYFTDSGVSATVALNFSKQKYDKEDFSDWTADNASIMLTFGYPISEYQKIFFGGGFRQIKIKTGYDVAEEIQDYIDVNGNKFKEIPLTASWVRDTTDSAYLPTKGSRNSLSLEAVPAVDKKYYRVDYSNKTFFSSEKTGSLVLGLHGDIGYGDSFSSGDDGLPFYRRYYAGGISTIRGYEHGSVGPKYMNGDYAGGDFRVTGGAELMMPVSFNKRSDNFRVGLFVDAGNVWSRAGDFDAGDFRYSGGAFINWLSPIGPLNLSYGVPLNSKEGDERESFQFTIGSSF
ncbi:MAG: outer membrane protein assembly factor BamA [Cardiobacteriaceae bacterium]|nr:outer membrane protein assembly factor BamA [Cardiobacteriaceae bacterium]